MHKTWLLCKKLHSFSMTIQFFGSFDTIWKSGKCSLRMSISLVNLKLKNADFEENTHDFSQKSSIFWLNYGIWFFLSL